MAHFLYHGSKIISFCCPLQQRKIQMIGMHHRIHGHKARHLTIAVTFIHIKELAITTIHHNKVIGCKLPGNILIRIISIELSKILNVG